MKQGETFLPDPFVLNAGTLSWIASKHPSVDVEETYAVFVDKALAKGWRYRDWNAAFRNYIRSGRMYGGVVHRQVNESELRWRNLLQAARAEHFREPHKGEAYDHYQVALELWKSNQNNNVLQFDILKRVAK